MTYRELVDAMLRYLRIEQRNAPYDGNSDYDDPLPDVLTAINEALQLVSVMAPYAAAHQGRGAYFRAAETVAVSALTRGGTTCMMADAESYMAGCKITLPGDSNPNRIIKISGTTVTFQFPHISNSTSGNADIVYDAAELPADVITVHEPVVVRGGSILQAAGSRTEIGAAPTDKHLYYIESTTATGGTPRLRMMLSNPPSNTDMAVEFQARVSLGRVTRADIYGDAPAYADPGVQVPIHNDHVESIFLPIALDSFFAMPAIVNYDTAGLKNVDSVRTVREKAAVAKALLENMKPQGKKPIRLVPWG